MILCDISRILEVENFFLLTRFVSDCELSSCSPSPPEESWASSLLRDSFEEEIEPLPVLPYPPTEDVRWELSSMILLCRISL